MFYDVIFLNKLPSYDSKSRIKPNAYIKLVLTTNICVSFILLLDFSACCFVPIIQSTVYGFARRASIELCFDIASFFYVRK